jgi:chemotaxis protein methyltransferase CheR
MFSVSILEAKTIIRTINRTYGTDLSGLAMASFRLRLSEILSTHKFKNTAALIERLLADPDYYELFIQDISTGSPDMFRDPDFWIYFRDELLPEVLKSSRYPEMIIPESVTGNEFYTMAVLLNETGLDYRIDLVVTCRNGKIKKQIMEGKLPNIRFKNSKDNYEVFHPGSSFENYTETRNGSRYLKTELLEGVEFRLQSPDQPVCSDKTALVLYRNRMIYQTTELQYRRLLQILKEMPKETYLITGIKEAINGFGLDHLYDTVSEDLKIYMKKDAD